MRKYDCLSLILLLALPGALHAQPALPNILLVLSDDHSAAHVGCYGNPDIKTPNLDAFAKQGIALRPVYVAAPQCVPSRAAIMTGRSPVAIQMTRFSRAAADEVKTCPELLRAAGLLRRRRGPHLSSRRLGAAARIAGRLREARAADLREAARLRQDRRRGDADRSRSIASSSTQVPKGKPFVLQLCFSDPHRPLDRQRHPANRTTRRSSSCPRTTPTRSCVREDFARYYDEIARFDGDFGAGAGRAERARPGGQHARRRSWATTARRSFAARARSTSSASTCRCSSAGPARSKPGSSTSELISGEDLAPTFLEAAGVSRAKEMTGRSFLKLLRGEPFAGAVRLRRARRARLGAADHTSAASTWAAASSANATSSSTTRCGRSRISRSISPATRCGRNSSRCTRTASCRRSCRAFTFRRRGRCSSCTTWKPTRAS